MATLSADITADAKHIPVSDPPQTLAIGQRFRIDDEVLRFEGYGGNSYPGGRDYGTWQVYRGQDGTAKAVHSSGATIQVAVEAFLAGTFTEPPSPFASPGGASDAASVSFDNVESEAEAENLQEAADELFAEKLDETAHDALDHTGLTGVGAAVTLAEVLAEGNDTGGVETVSAPAVDVDANVVRVATATGSGDADATARALSVDGAAYARSVAETTGDGTAEASSRAATIGAGDADASVIAVSVDALAKADIKAQATGNGDATSIHTAITAGSGDADATTAVTANGTGYADATIQATAGSNDAYADVRATSTTGFATAVNRATSGANIASIGPIADATRAEIQVNALPLYTEAAAGAPGAFASLFYRDTTASTGGTYLWNFVTGAYQKIALALT